MIKFIKTDKVKDTPMSKDFIDNVRGIIENKTDIYHSHTTGKIIGFAHSYCIFKVKENKSKKTLISHNLFKFNFVFFLKGLRGSVWRTRDIFIEGKNPTNISFAEIGDQVMFLDTIKYFQDKILTEGLPKSEKFVIQREFTKFIKKDENLSKKINICTEKDQEWMLNYLLSGRRRVPYKMITEYDSLNISAENNFFFLSHCFCSDLVENAPITSKDYANIKKFIIL